MCAPLQRLRMGAGAVGGAVPRSHRAAHPGEVGEGGHREALDDQRCAGTTPVTGYTG